MQCALRRADRLDRWRSAIRRSRNCGPHEIEGTPVSASQPTSRSCASMMACVSRIEGRLSNDVLCLLQRMSLFMCRFSDAGDDDRLCTLKRPAFEKRQGRKSRSVVRRRFGWLYGDLAGASGLGCVVMIHTPVRLDRDPAVNERVARRATRICGTSGCELSGSRRAWALSAASRRE
jgi:hypothetical protein